jgi:hypothetical protein
MCVLIFRLNDFKDFKRSSRTLREMVFSGGAYYTELYPKIPKPDGCDQVMPGFQLNMV